MEAQQQAQAPFIVALEALLDERSDLGATRRDRLSALSSLLDEMSRPRLEAVISGTSHPQLWLLEECAEALGVQPDYFMEWRIEKARRRYDVRLVGVDMALANFGEWVRTQSAR